MSVPPFGRCGFASIEEFKCKEFHSYFDEMEQYQNIFLKYENDFREGGYKWPRDPLHTWSRPWEYSYILHNIQKFKKATGIRHILDFGSGTTFFPFYIAEHDHNVVCVDVDPIVESEMKNAIKNIRLKAGAVSFRLIDGKELPFDDNSMDLIYSISVLEHIPDPAQIISEIHRVLKPGGHLLLTYDVAIGENCENIINDSFDMYNGLKFFNKILPETPISESSILTSNNGPYPLSNSIGNENILSIINRVLLKGIWMKEPRIACKGYVLVKA